MYVLYCMQTHKTAATETVGCDVRGAGGFFWGGES